MAFVAASCRLVYSSNVTNSSGRCPHGGGAAVGTASDSQEIKYVSCV
jgi:hypothetical protein